MREWINPATDGEPVFLIKVSFDGAVRGWQYADMSGVCDLLGTQAYYAEAGEEVDALAFFILTDTGPEPVEVKYEADQQMGMVEVSAFYMLRQPGVRARRTLAAKGFYRIPGA